MLAFPCAKPSQPVQLLVLHVCEFGCFHLPPVCLADSEQGKKKDLCFQLQCFVPQWHLAAAITDEIPCSPYSPGLEQVSADAL